MEILGLILVIVVYAFIRQAISAGARAAVRSATGKGSFSGNFEASFRGMRPLVTRLRSEPESEDRPFHVYVIEAKGLFPVDRNRRLLFSASILDTTGRNPDTRTGHAPVFCMLDRYQEAESIAYGDRCEVGEVKPDHGFVDWCPVVHIIPETLIAPRSGRRNFKVFVHLFDESDAPRVHLGYISNGQPLASWIHEFSWNVLLDGYEERSEKHRRAEEEAVRLAIAVAYADGRCETAENETIKSWISNRLSVLDAHDRPVRRDRFNDVLREAHARARQGNLPVGAILEELERCATPTDRIAAVELCLDVMSSDGHADASELRNINKIAERLEVDLAQYKDLKDKRLARVASTSAGKVDYYDLFHIDRSSSPAEIRKQLSALYAQWNARAEALSDPEKRAEAERMLEVIARAKQEMDP